MSTRMDRYNHHHHHHHHSGTFNSGSLLGPSCQLVCHPPCHTYNSCCYRSMDRQTCLVLGSRSCHSLKKQRFFFSPNKWFVLQFESEAKPVTHLPRKDTGGLRKCLCTPSSQSARRYRDRHGPGFNCQLKVLYLLCIILLLQMRA